MIFPVHLNSTLGKSLAFLPGHGRGCLLCIYGIHVAPCRQYVGIKNRIATRCRSYISTGKAVKYRFQFIFGAGGQCSAISVHISDSAFKLSCSRRKFDFRGRRLLPTVPLPSGFHHHHPLHHVFGPVDTAHYASGAVEVRLGNTCHHAYLAVVGRTAVHQFVYYSASFCPIRFYTALGPIKFEKTVCDRIYRHGPHRRLDMGR